MTADCPDTLHDTAITTDDRRNLLSTNDHYKGTSAPSRRPFDS